MFLFMPDGHQPIYSVVSAGIIYVMSQLLLVRKKGIGPSILRRGPVLDIWWAHVVYNNKKAIGPSMSAVIIYAMGPSILWDRPV